MQFLGNHHQFERGIQRKLLYKAKEVSPIKKRPKETIFVLGKLNLAQKLAASYYLLAKNGALKSTV
jgi:hypothetical protein